MEKLFGTIMKNSMGPFFLFFVFLALGLSGHPAHAQTNSTSEEQLKAVYELENYYHSYSRHYYGHDEGDNRAPEIIVEPSKLSKALNKITFPVTSEQVQIGLINFAVRAYYDVTSWNNSATGLRLYNRAVKMLSNSPLSEKAQLLLAAGIKYSDIVEPSVVASQIIEAQPSLYPSVKKLIKQNLQPRGKDAPPSYKKTPYLVAKMLRVVDGKKEIGGVVAPEEAEELTNVVKQVTAAANRDKTPESLERFQKLKNVLREFKITLEDGARSAAKESPTIAK